MSEKWCLIIDVPLTEEMIEVLTDELHHIEYSFPTENTQLPVYTSIEGRVCVARQRVSLNGVNNEQDVRGWVDDEYLEHEVRLSDITGEPRYVN